MRIEKVVIVPSDPYDHGSPATRGDYTYVHRDLAYPGGWHLRVDGEIAMVYFYCLLPDYTGKARVKKNGGARLCWGKFALWYRMFCEHNPPIYARGKTADAAAVIEAASDFCRRLRLPKPRIED
jgi:hypothetical protein